MKPKIAIDVCGIRAGKLSTKIVKCILCEEDCHYSGFGNENAVQFNKGEYIDLKKTKFKFKIVCTDCMHNFFEKEMKILIDLSEEHKPILEGILVAAKLVMSDNLRKK